jgi:hypothetical protein
LHALASRFKRTEAAFFAATAGRANAKRVLVTITQGDGSERTQVLHLTEAETEAVNTLKTELAARLGKNKQVFLTALSELTWDLMPEVNLIDDSEGKPVGNQQHIGRRPIAAFGNSDGDLQMLQWTAAGSGPRFCLYVHHTDYEREWAYVRQSHVGRLDKGLDEAKAKGWTVVSMKDDWKHVFPFER